ncbi:ASST-domain-containing protein [Aspergillus undulatus]|uniref:ASST-domain-containing protein n=1 Tax=Aspergillus undulatus TaxID=1810928 RepID=UPI003CCDAF5D
MGSRLFWGCWGVLVLAQVIEGDYVSTNYQSYNDGAFCHRPHLEFQSSSEYAPLLQVNTWKPDAISARGSHIFLRHDGASDSDGNTNDSSPLILDSRDLSVVYMNRTFNNVFGTRVQENLGKKYLTFWAGDKGDGVGDGYGLAYDDTYRLAYKVSAQNINVHADLHEFAFTGNGTALVTGVNRIRVSGNVLSERYGWDYILPDTLDIDILDGVVQEIDLKTNKVLFEWRALDHINPLDSFEPMGSGWDVYHINSIEKTQAGNYLISIRHTHSIYLIDGQTGAIIWTLGGARNNFIELPMAPALASPSPGQPQRPAQPLLTMAWQHHARFVPDTNESQLTLFDNHVKFTTHGECSTNCSRGLHIAINTTATPPTAQILHEFQHPANLQAQSQGSVQVLAPPPSGSVPELDLGSVFIGWGRCPAFTEHTASGETVLDVQFSPWHSEDIPDALDNYRAYKMDWVAEPWWDPTIAVAEWRDGNGTRTLVVYASWNGATEVDSWVVRGSVSVRNGNDDDNEDDQHIDGGDEVLLTTSLRTGFETKLTIANYAGGYPDGFHYRYLWAQALDAQGNILRSSEAVDLNTASILKNSSSDSSEYATCHDLGLKSSSSLPNFAQMNMNKSSTSPPTHSHARGLSPTALVLFGSGLGLLALTSMIVSGVVVFIHRRQRTDYDALTSSDFDLRSISVDDDDGEAGGSHEHSGVGGYTDEDEDRLALLSKPK